MKITRIALALALTASCLVATPAHAMGKVPGCISKGKFLYGKVYATAYPYQADVSVYQAQYSYQSDLKVFATKYDYQSTSCGLWNFVKYPYQANLKVYFTKYSYQANFSVYFTNYSYQAGTN
jgi:Family of unknown function (DUF6150)